MFLDLLILAFAAGFIYGGVWLGRNRDRLLDRLSGPNSRDYSTWLLRYMPSVLVAYGAVVGAVTLIAMF